MKGKTENEIEILINPKRVLSINYLDVNKIELRL